MMQTSAKDYRAAIERELRERLQPPAQPTATSSAPQGTTGSPLHGVALLCLKCRGTSDADARFCTSCGEPFNAMVVAPARGRA